MQSDLWSAGALIYRLLTCGGEGGSALATPDRGSELTFPPQVPLTLKRVVRRLLERSPGERYRSADEALAELVAPGGLPERLVGVAGPGDAVFAPPASLLTTIIALPSFEVLPVLPEGLLGDQKQGAFSKLCERLRNRFRRATPEFVQQLQRTELKLDEAIGQHERRREWLLLLRHQAESALVELNSAVLVPGRDQDPAVVVVQETHLAAITERLQSLEATVARLRSERGILAARLQLARTRLERAGRNTGGRKRIALVAQLALLAVLVGAAVYLYWKMGAATTVRELSERGFGAIPDAPSLYQRNLGGAPRPELSWLTAEQLTTPSRLLHGSLQGASSLAFVPGRNLVAGVGGDGAARIWETETGEEVRRYVNFTHGSTSSLETLAVSPDGRTAALGSQSAEKSLILWDIASGQEIRRMEGRTGHVRSIAFSPDGRTIAAVHRGDDIFAPAIVRLWDAATGKSLPRLDIEALDVQQVAFSRAQPWLACFGNASPTIEIWDTRTRERRTPLRASEGIVTTIAFSADGSQLAAGLDNGAVLIWDAQTGALSDTIKLPVGRIQGLAISPDRRHLLAGSVKLTVLWDIAAARIEQCLAEAFSRLAFSDDGEMFAAGGWKIKSVLCNVAPPGRGTSDHRSDPLSRAEVSRLSSLKQARFLTVMDLKHDPDFLRSVEDSIPSAAAPVSIAPEPAVWHEVTLNAAGAGFDVLRLVSPLDEPADFVAAIVESDALRSWNLWNLLGPEESIVALGDSYSAEDVDLPGLDLPDRNTVLFVASTGSKIEPGRQYALWFCFDTAEPIDVRFAIHLRPATAGLQIRTVDQIAQTIGWPAPLPKTGYSRGSFNMELPTVRNIPPFAPGNPYNRNPISPGQHAHKPTRFYLRP